MFSYVFILYHYNSNTIHADQIPSRNRLQLLHTYKNVINILENHSLKPCLQRLDNECSTSLKEFMTSESINLQLTLKGLHCRNLVECAIKTYKNHFIANICSTHTDFPPNLWDKPVPQSVLIINLLRPACLNRNISAHAYLHVAFAYNQTHIVPSDIKIIDHVRPEERGSCPSPCY